MGAFRSREGITMRPIAPLGVLGQVGTGEGVTIGVGVDVGGGDGVAERVVSGMSAIGAGALVGIGEGEGAIAVGGSGWREGDFGSTADSCMPGVQVATVARGCCSRASARSRDARHWLIPARARRKTIIAANSDHSKTVALIRRRLRGLSTSDQVILTHYPLTIWRDGTPR